MVVNRALSPSSKLAIEQWAAEEVFLGGDEAHASGAALLPVDLIFFDTTNTYFEIEEPCPSELKAYGKSKEKRDDLPLVTVGLTMTREGILTPSRNKNYCIYMRVVNAILDLFLPSIEQRYEIK